MKKKTLISIISVGVSALMFASVLGGCSGGSSNSVLASNKEYAEKVVSQFASGTKAAEFEFSDQAFAKADIAALMYKPGLKAEELQQIARDLFLTSITVANEKGEIVACYPEGAESGKLKESKDKSSFNKIVKGMSDKLMNEPLYDEETGMYSVLAGVTRKDEPGAVIVGYDTADYAKVTGTELAKSCGPNAIVVKDDIVLSTTLDGIETGKNLDGIGVKDDDLKKDSFTLKVGDKNYTAMAGTKGEYIVIVAAAQ